MSRHPHGRRLLPFPNVDDAFLRPYRAACQTFEACPEASAAHARQCLHMVLGAQGYLQDCLAARIDAAIRDQNPKKRLPAQVRSGLDALRRYETFGAPDTDLTVPSALRDVATGEAEATIAAAEALLDYCYEAPKRMEDELEALRRALAEGKSSGDAPLVRRCRFPDHGHNKKRTGAAAAPVPSIAMNPDDAP